MRQWRRKELGVVLVVAVVVLGKACRDAVAEDGAPHVMVAAREADARRRALQPQGWQGGGVRVDAEIEQRALWTDNLYSAHASPVESWGMATKAMMQVATGEEPWWFSARARGETLRYPETASLDHTNADLRLGVEGKGWNRSFVNAVVEVVRDHELPGDPSLPGAAAEPVAATHLRGKIDSLLRRGRLFVGGQTRVSYSRFATVRDWSVEAVDHAQRNGWAIEGATRVGIAPTRTLDVFVENQRGSRRSVKPEAAATILTRDRDDTAYSVGVAVDLSDRMIGEASYGLMETRWRSPLWSPVRGRTAHVALEVAITPLTSVVLDASRRVEPTAVTGFAGAIVDQANIEIEHELLRRLTVRGAVGGDRWRFVGPSDGGIPERDDKRLFARIGGEWRWNARWYCGLEVLGERRSSSWARFGFDRTRVSWRVGARL